ncbi:TolC family protein [Solitalea sp. MAHUQ-68]|uniref:TolC family protein n=1 Tax=Solitalea agri TaxID=2953739 RepID=A0A9X2F4C8_9SPHI|nr:TolC family protein [Solitalea agri]MCO4294527.1 TolC family protein [Solitalea agri]
MKPILTLIIAGIMTTSTVLAQEQPQTHVFKLEDCLNYAYTHQTNLQNAKLDEEIAKSKVKETIAIGLPQVDGTVSFQHFINTPVFPFSNPAYGLYSILNEEGVKDGSGQTVDIPADVPPTMNISFQPKNILTGTIQVSQLLFDGTYLMGLKAAGVYRELSSKNVKRTEIDTRIAVSKAYYNVIVYNAFQNTLESTIDRLKETLKQTDALNKSGMVEKIDLDRLQVLLNNAETQKRNLDRMSELNTNLLKFQMGMPIGEQLTVNEKLEDMKLDATLPVLEGVKVENRIEYSMLQTQKQLLEYDLKRYKLAYVPSVGAYASFGQTGQNDAFYDTFKKFFPTNIVGVNFTIPIWSSGQRKQRINQAKFNLNKTVNDMTQLKNSLELDLKANAITFQNNKDQVENQRKNMDLASEVVRVSKIKYSQGVGSSLEVTTAESDLRTSQNNYYTAVYDAILAWIDLQKAMGNFN